MFCCCCFFFFSSRRRHTRYIGDWSSDVCSSDLWERPFLGVAMWFFMFGFAGLPLGGGFLGKFLVFAAAYRHGWTWLVIIGVLATIVSLYYYLEIGRASCRERVEVPSVERPVRRR